MKLPSFFPAREAYVRFWKEGTRTPYVNCGPWRFMKYSLLFLVANRLH